MCVNCDEVLRTIQHYLRWKSLWITLCLWTVKALDITIRYLHFEIFLHAFLAIHMITSHEIDAITPLLLTEADIAAVHRCIECLLSLQLIVINYCWNQVGDQCNILDSSEVTSSWSVWSWRILRCTSILNCPFWICWCFWCCSFINRRAILRGLPGCAGMFHLEFFNIQGDWWR